MDVSQCFSRCSKVVRCILRVSLFLWRRRRRQPLDTEFAQYPVGANMHGQRFKTKRHAKDEIVARLLWYNSARLNSTLGYVSPMAFENSRLAA